MSARIPGPPAATSASNSASRNAAAGPAPARPGSGRGRCWRVDGLSYAQEDVSGLPAVIEFDPGTLVLTAFGRVNAGTIRGDRAVADQFLNSFFRI